MSPVRTSKWPALHALVAAICVFQWPALARAGGPVILLETKVGPYRTAAHAAERSVPSAVELDVDGPATDPLLADASAIIAIGRRSLTVARRTAGTRPIVFCMVLGVGRADLSASITGVPLNPAPSLVLETIRDLSPTFRRIGLLINANSDELVAAEARRAASELGLALEVQAVDSAVAARGAVEALPKDLDVLWLPADPKTFTKELFSFILSTTAERRLPVVAFLEGLTEAGALASISPNYVEIGDRAGKLAAEILARPEGKRYPVPAPVFAPGDLSLNLKTARVLGVELSSHAVSRASRVFR